jgi:ribosomal protein S18 acetylase RimI-like enzyme
MAEGNVVRVPSLEAHRVVDVLAEAFFDYPVMRFVLSDAGEDYPHRLRTLVGFFVMARAFRDEPLLGVPLHGGGEADRNEASDSGGALAAAATVSLLDGRPSPPELAEMRERVWGQLGEGARARYESCGHSWAPLEEVGHRHIHLNMIGVRDRARGLGLARRLIDRVHEISRATPGSKGVTLTTEDPANVRIYERLGYHVVGHVRIAPELESWGMFRLDQ